ncbi:hypothetical protein AUC61_15605 [Pseudomonas sp. S25]|uniref:Uncharacterized protein n=1 Tax=Pseudomonas maioricensis TaxID=1766623 RepID=A0ABS9ZK56_9PSED|nr:hypothetical protein [Pseudomonas sp. S25]MCI8210959.1 hypothetical protein [Pseudomonas sp. S25]
MAAYFIGKSDVLGLNNFQAYLERYAISVDSFLKNLTLPLLQSGQHPALNNVAARAKRDIPLWPGTVKNLRQLHQDATRVIDEANELVSQLKLYKRPEGTDAVRENLNTLLLHAEPFNMNGKLGISPSSKTYDVTYFLSQKLTQFDGLLYTAFSELKLLLQTATDIIPRTVDFMRVKIAEHEARHRRPDSTFSGPVQKQLDLANSSLDASRTEYTVALEAAGNVLGYCTRLRETLNDSRNQLLLISDKSNVRTFIFQINQMGTRLTLAQNMINRTHSVL